MNKSEIIFIVEESEDGGFVANALGHSIYTQADSYEQVKEAIREAVLCNFDEGDAPQIIRIHFVRDEVMAI